ncbi:MAG: BMP family ABC transporter substrate-binding protein [Anaerolineales bacterium]
MNTARHLALLFLTLGLLLPGCRAAPPDCARAEVFCVGLVTASGGIDDRALNQAAWEGLQQAGAIGMADWTAYIESAERRDYGENIRFFASHDYDAIVTVGSDLAEATSTAAERYPHIYFIGVDQTPPAAAEPLPNLASLAFPEDQLGFLAGALAARMTSAGKVGAVLGSDAWASMRRYGEGFRAGVLYADPAVEAVVVYHNEVEAGRSLDDFEWGALTANTLIDGEVDVLFAAGGQTAAGALLSGAARGIYVIGSEADQYPLLPEARPRLLTSAVKQVAPGVILLVTAAHEAQAGKAGFPSGLLPGGVDLAPYHETAPLVGPEIQQEMLTLLDGLRTGVIQTGVLP